MPKVNTAKLINRWMNKQGNREDNIRKIRNVKSFQNSQSPRLLFRRGVCLANLRSLSSDMARISDINSNTDIRASIRKVLKSASRGFVN